ncbi:MAG: acetate/propionate family kinase, partial [Gammaproteobacteria bacterium]
MKVLVLNAGSSSIKYELFDMAKREVLAAGLMERIGEPQARLKHRHRKAGAMQESLREGAVADHREGFAWIGEALRNSGVVSGPEDLSGVGHRVVHGGDAFQAAALIDARVVARIREQIPLAPLHNPANLVGIEVAMAGIPDVPQVAVFDTAFHHSMPPHAYRYALPDELYGAHRVRRYGFHGTSHAFVAKQAALYLGQPLDTLNLISLHLGNGASAAAIENGRSIDTSMGMTPLEGLVMGTRCGDLDPAIVFFLARETGLDNDALESLLNRDSGLKGICGVNDMREVLRRVEDGDERAELAIDIYAYRIKKYIGAYCAALGRIDAIVFTAGIGENSPDIRSRACSGLS